MEVRPAPTPGSIAAALLEHVVEEARADLRSEHPASAVELYFGPIGCHALPSDSITRGSCSIDGYYTSDVDPHQLWIFYADDVHEDRARFTIRLRGSRHDHHWNVAPLATPQPEAEEQTTWEDACDGVDRASR